MKFLCIKCDESMKLTETSGPDDSGSLAVVFACGSCSHSIAMLTNAHETQLVTSLGVKIGPDGEETESKCPFSAMIGGGSSPAEKGAGGLEWTAEAKARLDRIPEFVRPMAKMGIEKLAEGQGKTCIDESMLEAAKSMYGF